MRFLHFGLRSKIHASKIYNGSQLNKIQIVRSRGTAMPCPIARIVLMLKLVRESPSEDTRESDRTMLQLVADNQQQLSLTLAKAGDRQ